MTDYQVLSHPASIRSKILKSQGNYLAPPIKTATGLIYFRRAVGLAMPIPIALAFGYELAGATIGRNQRLKSTFVKRLTSKQAHATLKNYVTAMTYSIAALSVPNRIAFLSSLCDFIDSKSDATGFESILSTAIESCWAYCNDHLAKYAEQIWLKYVPSGGIGQKDGIYVINTNTLSVEVYDPEDLKKLNIIRNIHIAPNGSIGKFNQYGQTSYIPGSFGQGQGGYGPGGFGSGQGNNGPGSFGQGQGGYGPGGFGSGQGNNGPGSFGQGQGGYGPGGFGFGQGGYGSGSFGFGQGSNGPGGFGFGQGGYGPGGFGSGQGNNGPSGFSSGQGDYIPGGFETSGGSTFGQLGLGQGSFGFGSGGPQLGGPFARGKSPKEQTTTVSDDVGLALAGGGAAALYQLLPPQAKVVVAAVALVVGIGIMIGAAVDEEPKGDPVTPGDSSGGTGQTGPTIPDDEIEEGKNQTDNIPVVEEGKDGGKPDPNGNYPDPDAYYPAPDDGGSGGPHSNLASFPHSNDYYPDPNGTDSVGPKAAGVRLIDMPIALGKGLNATLRVIGEKSFRISG